MKQISVLDEQDIEEDIGARNTSEKEDKLNPDPLWLETGQDL